MPRFAKKGPFDDLDSDFKTSIEGMKDDEIKAKIFEVACNEVDNLKAKKDDQDLKDKKESAKMAGETYTESTKFNRMRIGYAKFILEARGKA